nr:hypothetical protein [Streptomyces sp. San01]
MLLWINGPFGAAIHRTRPAYEIRRRLPGSVVCDPEHIGFGLHRLACTARCRPRCAATSRAR